MALDTHWCSVNFDSLLIQEWEDGFTVFQANSGRTHFLSPLGMQILADISEAADVAMTEAEICINLAARLQPEVGPELGAVVRKTLHRFDELGLIEKVAGTADRES